ncbi:uncharacterized protein LOC62_04G006099 [Vanrija pseudolonga]|uniref:Uncharacterized protein n=1 Tax=Vanrija pseudolonga TaxID=143232 RepID=A0AAF1BN10_9TREE|nr:hypothetical protein LOC62_04G006099 [Vanrija pseudolonga]
MDTDNTVDIVDTDTSTDEYELPPHPWFRESLSHLNNITPVEDRKVFFGRHQFLGGHLLAFEPTVSIGPGATSRFLSAPSPVGYCTNPASSGPEEVDMSILTHLDMNRNLIGDDGFATALWLASRSPNLESLTCSGNMIEFDYDEPREAAAVLTAQLAKSNLRYLVLDNNDMSVNPKSFQELFKAWARLPRPPPMQELHLQYCGLGLEHAISLALFALSPAASNLQVLYLDNNDFTDKGFYFLSMMLTYNYTIRAVSRYVTHAYDSSFRSGGTWSIPEDDSAAMEFLRFASVTCDRNEALHNRIITATRRALPSLRMVAHAKPLEEETTDPDLQGLKLNNDSEGQETQVRAEPSTKPFPFMKLPYEVRLLVARHASGDPGAFNTDQRLSRLPC